MPQPSPVTNVQPLRILYASDQIMPSTAADTEQAVNTVAALGRRGVEVHLVLPRRPGTRAVTVELLQEHYQVRGPFKVSQIETSFDSIRWARNGAHAAKVAGRFGSQHIDLVYTRNLPALAASLARGHRVAYDHFRPWPDVYPPLQGPLRWLMRHPRFLSAFLHSDHTRQSFLRVGIPGERLVVAHNGYDPARMEPHLDRRRARERVELPVEGAVAVYAGRLNERKGLDVVLEMARQCPEALFVLVGSEEEGKIELQAGRIANVRIVPWQRFDVTIPYLYAADVLLIPPCIAPLQQHANTVLPLKVFLYLAAGRAILAPRAPDTSELLVDGKNALLVPPGDPDTAVGALRHLMEHRTHRERLGRAALETARHLTWDTRAEKIHRHLEDRLKETQVAGRPLSDSWSVTSWFGETARWLARRIRKG